MNSMALSQRSVVELVLEVVCELVHSRRCRPAAEEQSLTITTLKEPRPGKRTSPFAIKQVSNNTIDELRICLFQ